MPKILFFKTIFCIVFFSSLFIISFLTEEIDTLLISAWLGIYLFLSRNTKKVFCNYYYSSYEIEERLVEIYYDVLDKNIKDDYRINDVKKLEDTRYQNFIKHCLPTKLDRQITINNIPLDKLIQESFETDGSLSKFQ